MSSKVICYPWTTMMVQTKEKIRWMTWMQWIWMVKRMTKKMMTTKKEMKMTMKKSMKTRMMMKILKSRLSTSQIKTTPGRK